MARRKKPKPFRAVKAVKAAARQAIGTPPPMRRESSSKNKTDGKHKPTLSKLLGELD
jgi:hypothetical protein